MSEFYDLLTPREQEVYCKIINNIRGLSREDMAKELHIKKSTFDTHLINIFLKTGTSSQIELIVKHYHKRGNLWNKKEQ